MNYTRVHVRATTSRRNCASAPSGGPARSTGWTVSACAISPARGIRRHAPARRRPARSRFSRPPQRLAASPGRMAHAARQGRASRSSRNPARPNGFPNSIPSRRAPRLFGAPGVRAAASQRRANARQRRARLPRPPRPVRSLGEIVPREFAHLRRNHHVGLRLHARSACSCTMEKDRPMTSMTFVGFAIAFRFQEHRDHHVGAHLARLRPPAPPRRRTHRPASAPHIHRLEQPRIGAGGAQRRPERPVA